MRLPLEFITRPIAWRTGWSVILLCVHCGLAVPCCTAIDWPTNRGNSSRTGSVDNSTGPATGHVLWVHKSTDQYVAAPVPAGDSLLVSSLAAFNTSSFQAMAVGPQEAKRIRWVKSAPALKLPTVCAPAVAGNLVVFGDGMHQTDGAVLHGVRLDTGLPLWELPVAGQLVHLEGSPTIVQDRVLIGGGNAGVLCVDPTQLELEGKRLDPAASQALLESRWKELVAKYELEKKADPDFAIPPNEDSLPKPKPRLIWQAGADKWHVDAPVAVAQEFVIVASAFLDQEKVGDRALHCLNLIDGKPMWKFKLKFNPWAGVTIAGDTVIVGCSNIRLEPRDVGRAQGEVLAVSLASGAPKWRKPIAAGVLSSIAANDSTIVFTATDGSVRAWDLQSGEERWKTDGGTPFFASPALAKDVVYTADLKGVVQALSLADGRRLWSLDLASNPAVQAPGMVYGGPVVSGGRLFVATCNLEAAGKAATAVVCIGGQ